METDDFTEEDLRDLGSTEGFRRRDEVRHLGLAIDDDEDGIVVRGEWEVGDPVE